jgi:hypothetical protein
MRVNNIYSTQMRANELAMCTFSRFIEKWPRNDQEMTKKWPKNDQEMTKKWPRNDQEMTKKWPRNDQEMTKKWQRIDGNQRENILQDWWWLISPILICHSSIIGNEIEQDWMRVNGINSTQRRVNNIYSTQMRVNEIVMCTFSWFIEKWPRLDGNERKNIFHDW